MLPLVSATWTAPERSVYVLLLAYFAHQLEEHLHDRFRLFVNEVVGGGLEALTPRATMVINVGLVWIGYLAVLLGTAFVDPGLGLIAAYATLVNGASHVAFALVRRRANPGVWTSAALFLPAGAWAWRSCSRASGLGPCGHVLGLAIAALAHLGIVGWVRWRRARLSPGSRAEP